VNGLDDKVCSITFTLIYPVNMLNIVSLKPCTVHLLPFNVYRKIMTIFTKIVNGEIPCHKIAEDENFLAFLDITPLADGHTLVIPKKEVDYIFDLDNDLLSGLMLFAKKIAPAIAQACPCRRVGVSVIGLEVPHAHVHLIPLNSMNDINFTREKLKPSQEELKATAERIVGYL
jgi:histidine triad (HIT) family protein